MEMEMEKVEVKVAADHRQRPMVLDHLMRQGAARCLHGLEKSTRRLLKL